MEGPEATRYSPEEPLFDERYKGESKIHSVLIIKFILLLFRNHHVIH